MADDKKKKPDVVEDGGLKCRVPVLNKIFASCSSGEDAKPGGIAPPMMTNVAPMDPAGQKVVQDKAAAGDYGEGLQKTQNAVKARMDALNAI